MFRNIILTSRKKFETEIAKRTMEASEEISNAIGAEVHDDLIQKLTIFSLNIDRLERLVHHPAESEELIVKMRTDFLQMTSSVRRISRNLMPDILDGANFTRSIELLCENLELPSQGLVHFTSEGIETKLPHTTKKYLHRMVQELVHNAFKNSSAWHVWVGLHWKPDHLIIHVEDDGTAFSSLNEQIAKLNNKHNTLRLRSMAVGAEITYRQGKRGLLARVTVGISS